MRQRRRVDHLARAGPSPRTACRGRAAHQAAHGQAKPALVIRRASGRRDRQHRGRMAARGDRPVGLRGDAGQPQELLRRRRAVGVDEADEVGVGARGTSRRSRRPSRASGTRRARPASSRAMLVRRSLRCGRGSRPWRRGIGCPGRGRRRGSAVSMRPMRCSSLCAGMTMSRRMSMLPSGARTLWDCSLRHGPAEATAALVGGCPCVRCETRECAGAHYEMARMADATVAEEEYLQTIFWLQEAGLPMTGANVARAMQLSAPTVHEMVGRLERDGYITRARRQVDRASPTTGLEHAEDDRPPPPADRALPHRRARRSRGTRSTRRPSGWSTRCRRCSRSACSPRSATPRPARTATRSTPAARIAGVPLGRRRGRRQGHGPALRERGRGPAALPQGRRAWSPGLEGTLAERDDEHVVVDADGDAR